MKKLSSLLVLVLVASFLAACPAPTPEVIEVPKEVVVEKKVIETVEVVKEVVVEKVVKETVIVEKEVEKLVYVTPAPEAAWPDMTGVTLQYMGGAPDEMQVMWGADWNEATGGVMEFVEVPWGDYRNKWQALYAAQDDSIELGLTGADRTPGNGEAGHLLIIDDWISEELKNDLIPATLDACVWKGNYYALPRFLSLRTGWYNTELFEAAGLDPDDPPENFDEFVEYAKQLTMDTDGDGQTDTWGWCQEFDQASSAAINFGMFMISADLGIYNDFGELLFNNETGVMVLEKFRELYEAGAINPTSFEVTSPGVTTEFVQGRAGMIFHWPNVWIEAHKPESKIAGKVKMWLIPGINHSASINGVEAIAINNYISDERKEQAYEYLEFVASPEEQKRLTINHGWLPVRQSVIEDPEVQAANPIMEHYAEQAKFPATRFPAPWYSETMDILGNEVRSAMVDGKDPKQALDDAEKAMKEVIAKYVD